MRTTALALFALLAASVAPAQVTDSRTVNAADTLPLDVRRIFAGREFAAEPVPGLHWLADGSSYLDVRSKGEGSELVRVNVVTGAASVVVPASALVDAKGQPIAVEDVVLSGDESKALLFSNSVRVWRRNTRGLHHVVDLRTHKVTPVSRAEGLQMFAKFSPDARQVAFVRDNDLWVTDLASGREVQLTKDGSADIINGTTDWVYEEELGLADAFRWSPDGRHIAFWRFDQSKVPEYPLVDPLTLYPSVSLLHYPKAGQPNSDVRLGVIHLTSGNNVTWLDVGRGSDQYLARMEWVGSDSVVVQRLPRKQNQVEVLLASANSGGTRLVMTDRDSAYVDVEDVRWLADQKRFLWLSDRTGWRQLFLYDRTGRVVRQLTADGMDVLGVNHVDEARGHVYVTAAAPTPMERNVYRLSLSGGAPQRVTPARGTHSLTFAPGGRWAVGRHSSLGVPTRVTLHELPSMTERRVLVENTQLSQRVTALGLGRAEFIKVPMPDGLVLDGYRILPANFDSTRKHPVLMYVYGGPASPQVSDAWGGTRYLWFQSLAQKGYVVVAVDNRGAAWRGRDFRKVTQYRLGVLESQDQMDVARWLGRQSWVDASRIGIWGWSYGGYLTALTASRGGDLFRAAIAVAPVTDWRYYDSIYTERFMWIPQENATGYDAGSVLTHANGLTARLLLVHGTGDDNVHDQNTLVLADRLAGLGKLYSMMLYPNRTHSISERGVTPQLYETLTRFILGSL